MRFSYIAVLTPFEDGTGYTAEVPDVPGCVTSGRDFDDAVEMVKDALAGCLCVLEDHGATIPPPASSLRALLGMDLDDGVYWPVYVEVDTEVYRKECENARP